MTEMTEEERHAENLMLIERWVRGTFSPDIAEERMPIVMEAIDVMLRERSKPPTHSDWVNTIYGSVQLHARFIQQEDSRRWEASTDSLDETVEHIVIGRGDPRPYVAQWIERHRSEIEWLKADAEYWARLYKRVGAESKLPTKNSKCKSGRNAAWHPFLHQESCRLGKDVPQEIIDRTPKNQAEWLQMVRWLHRSQSRKRGKYDFGDLYDGRIPRHAAGTLHTAIKKMIRTPSSPVVTGVRWADRGDSEGMKRFDHVRVCSTSIETPCSTEKELVIGGRIYVIGINHGVSGVRQRVVELIKSIKDTLSNG